jgi:hypothetical protein
MLKLQIECSIVGQDSETGYWKREVVTGRDIYSFMIALASTLFLINSEAGDYHKAKEIEEMEGGELPF